MKRTVLKLTSALFVLAAIGGGISSLYAAENQPVAAAQQSTIRVTGKVVDKSGQPLVGVSVVQTGHEINGTMTDVEGAFAINVPSGSKLTVSYIGFQTQTVAASIGKMTITLEEDTVGIDEVVVTALGITRDKKTLGYAIQEVKGEAILEAHEVNIANALTGKIAGVQITRSSGGPGSSSKITLRGNNSLTGLNQPLIVVDGTPMDNFTGADNNDFWNPSADMGNGLQDINAEDIESMSVLKGASAAALYGSRAGNGVILITTKKGRKTEGLGLTFNGTVTASTIFTRPDYQTDFGQGSQGIYDPNSGSSWGAKIEGQEYERWDGSIGRMQYHDNLRSFLQTGVDLTGNVTFSQQYGKTAIYSSLTRTNDQSTTPGAELRRTNLMLRGNTAFGKDDRWSFDAKIQYIRARANNRPISGSNDRNVARTMYMMPASLDITEFANEKDADGNMYWYNTGNNPYWMLRWNQNEDTRDRMLMNASLKYQFTDWLSAEIRAGSDMYFTETTTHVYAGNPNLAGGTGSYSQGESRFYENNYSFLLSAQKDNIVGEWGGALTFGGNLMDRMSKGLSSSVGQLNIPDLFSLNNGVSTPGVSQSFSHRKMNSLYGTAQINYGGFVFLDATFRNDWTSTLSKANRSFFYPSVSLSWVISDMVNKYGSMPEWFTYAKVRASFAQVGNDMDPYQLYNEYSVGNPGHNAGNTTSTGNVLFNANVRNELISSWETGFDVRFFNNRLGLDFAYYKSNATNQLINLPMNGLSGYNSKKVNAGNIQNEGIEVMLNATPVQTKKFTWTSQFNIAHNNNTIIELADGVETYGLGGYDNVQIYAQVGGAYGEIYGRKFRRVTDESSPYFGQMLLDEAGLPVASTDSEKMGTQQAKVNLGWNNSFSFHNVTIGFQIDARIGGKMFSGTLRDMQASGNAAKTVVNGQREDFVLDGVVSDGEGGYVKNTNSITHQQYWGAVASRGGNLGITEANLYNATNVRLRNVSIAYSFPKSLLKRSNVFQAIKVGFTVTNVCMIKSYMDGLDPESVYATKTNATGFEYGANPTTRAYVFNVSLGF